MSRNRGQLSLLGGACRGGGSAAGSHPGTPAVTRPVEDGNCVTGLAEEPRVGKAGESEVREGGCWCYLASGGERERLPGSVTRRGDLLRERDMCSDGESVGAAEWLRERGLLL
ncbi:hypothetical protein E2C01_100471 [Portunus trituberculatus]|uniref:Uncharacterized protein n=1 Tax=Portunus trituberculatus TaxID=210409 RepID=A0A5B7KJJ3_PORTR|nr:hypothetical protein [Portunus trituberculatus]